MANALALKRIAEYCHDCPYYGDREKAFGMACRGQVGCTVDRACSMCYMGRPLTACPGDPPRWLPESHVDAPIQPGAITRKD